MGEILTIKQNEDLYKDVLALRQLILRDPLSMTYTNDELEADKKFIFFAYRDNGELLGTVSLEALSKEKAQLRQMAVHDRLQGKGVGRELVMALEDYCRKNGFKEIHLDARYPARGFYAKLGYTEYGAIYDKIGIKHIDMMKKLS